MAWILLVVALALGAGLLIITFGYTKSLAVLLVALLIGLISVIWYAEFHDSSRSSLIAVDEVGVDNFSVRTTYGNSFEMFARVHNRSDQHTLIAVGLELSALDCATGDQQAESCVTVGQKETEIPVSIPPLQARDTVQQFIFPPMRPQGMLQWRYAVLYTKAKK